MQTRARSRWWTAVCAAAVLALSGCNTLPFEQGAIWCNDPLVYDPPHGKHFDARHLNVARHGYLYALAGAHVLQGESEMDLQHLFRLPPRLKRQGPTRDDRASGFAASTYELFKHENDAKPEQVIIAFDASNDVIDWILVNILFDQRQYALARDFTRQVHEHYQGTPIIVTGYSLGGALAGHVAKHEQTRELVTQAWLFNPSPKLYTNNRYEKKIWIGALRGEFLSPARGAVVRAIWPGVNRIGAPASQDAQDYYLISSFTVGGHYRWVLARNILFVAEYAHLHPQFGPVDAQRLGEPREIIKLSSFAACERYLAQRRRLEAKRGPGAGFAIAPELEAQQQRAMELDHAQATAPPQDRE